MDVGRPDQNPEYLTRYSMTRNTTFGRPQSAFRKTVVFCINSENGSVDGDIGPQPGGEFQFLD